MKRKFIKEKAVFQILLVVSLIFFTASIITKEVKAVETAGCCVDAGNGQYCQSVSSSSQCVSGFNAGVSCSSVSQCANKGCCNTLDTDGICSSNVPKTSCESQNGLWSSDPLCGSDLDCQPKCCIIGNEWRLDYKKNCDYYGGGFLDSVTSAGDCSAQVTNVDEGCCNYNNKKEFKFTIKSDCVNLNGEFFKNTLCKNVAGYSDAGYESHKTAKCGPEGTSKIEDVYWYDSAGNTEDKKLNCDPDNLQSATICGDSDNNGEYTCESLDCANTWDNPAVDGDGGFRKNGESWCEYQAQAGPGLDLPGTSHYRHKCENGKEIVEACNSDRSDICVQGVMDYSGNKISWAKCIENSGEECLSYTSEDDCAKNNCVWAGSRCLPLSPPGNFMSGSTGDYCSEVNMEMQTAWNKKCGGNWRCQSDCSPLNPYNPNCDKSQFGESKIGNCQPYTDEALYKFTNLCNTLGDCGAKYNLVGEYSNKGVTRSGSKCSSSSGTNIIYGQNVPPCYSHPPDYYYKFENFVNAGKGLFVGEISASQLDSTGSLSGRQLVAMALNIFGNEKYLQEFDVGEASVTGWNMVGNVLISVVAGAITFTTIGILLFKMVIIGCSTGVGCAVVAVIAVVAILVGYLVYKVLPKLTDCPKTDKKTVSFSCGAWKPPKGGDDCEKCSKKISEGGLLPDYKFSNEDSYVCTENLCKSLGTWCEYDYTTYNCLKVDPQDLFPPSISIDKSITKYYCNKELPGDVTQCNEDANQGINIVTESGRDKGAEIKGELIDISEAATNKKKPILTLGIKTDEASICKFDTSKKSYDEMSYSFSSEDSENTRNTQHNITLPNNDIIWTDSCGEYNLYVQCEDFQGNKGNLLEDRSYLIKFKAAKQPDQSPVIIDENKINPLPGSYVKYGDKDKNIEVQLDEPAQCRWDNKPNINYDDMKNEFSCTGATIAQTQETAQADLTQEDLEGETDAEMCDPAVKLTCETTLTNITTGENKFYFKCKDIAGNANTQDWPQIGIQKGYALYGSSGNLTISETNCIHNLPNGETKTECGDIYAFNYTLRLRTDGGMDGTAECKYGFNTAANTDFFSTGRKEHTQLFAPEDGLPEGSQTVNVECVDKAGNFVSKTVTNFIKADRTSPKMERIYLDGSYLTLETNEKSTCKFANILKFDYDKASEMKLVNGLAHKAVADKDYYKIGCKDIFGNSMAPVSVTILGKDIRVG